MCSRQSPAGPARGRPARRGRSARQRSRPDPAPAGRPAATGAQTRCCPAPPPLRGNNAHNKISAGPSPSRSPSCDRRANSLLSRSTTTAPRQHAQTSHQPQQVAQLRQARKLAAVPLHHHCAATMHTIRSRPGPAPAGRPAATGAQTRCCPAPPPLRHDSTHKPHISPSRSPSCDRRANSLLSRSTTTARQQCTQ